MTEKPRVRVKARSTRVIPFRVIEDVTMQGVMSAVQKDIDEGEVYAIAVIGLGREGCVHTGFSDMFIQDVYRAIGAIRSLAVRVEDRLEPDGGE